jgi:ABC-type glycerol-3-phosphate transport system substrate-binding protein
MKLFKHLSPLLLISLVTAGCTSDSRSDTEHKVFIPDVAALKTGTTPIDIEFRHALTSPAHTSAIDDYIASFKTIYPNVNITHTSQGTTTYPLLETLVTNQLKAGNPASIPDIVLGYPDHFANYMTGDYVVNLDEYINSKDTKIGLTGKDGADNYAKDDIIEAYLDEFKSLPYKGTYGIPFNKSTEVLIYNKTILEEVGFTIPASDAWTYDDIISAGAKLRNTPKYADKVNFMPLTTDAPANLFLTAGQQWGGEYTKRDGDQPSKHLIIDKKFVEGVKYIEELVKKDYLSAANHFAGAAYSSGPFLESKIAMMIGSSAGVGYNIPGINGNTGTKGEFEVGVAGIPQPAKKISGSKKQAIQQGTSLALLWKGPDASKKKEGNSDVYDLKRLASWLFVRHMTSTTNTADWAIRTGYAPVRLSAKESPRVKEFLNASDKGDVNYYRAQSLKATYDQSDAMFFNYAFPGSSQIRIEAGTTMEAILGGGHTTEDAIAAMRTAVKSKDGV